MAARSRIERCSSCGVQLLVPPLTRTVRCAACHGATTFRGGCAGRAQGRIGQVTGWVRGLMSSPLRLNPRPQPDPVGGSGSAWPPSYPRACGRKRAVLIGVSYTGRGYELKGTVNDVHYMKFFLTTKFGFPEACILVLTEEERDPYRIPTKENMRCAMRWLVHNCVAGDSLVFHFSGHGSQKVDSSEVDEKDGFDETLCPLDYEINGMILDDEINETIVRPIPSRAKLHAIIDACHSGTVLDLPYVCRLNRTGFYQWEDHTPSSRNDKGTSGGLAICISGCADHQTSADTSALAIQATTGAMTYSLILAVESEPGTTYGNLLLKMRSVIRGANTGTKLTGQLASFARKVLNYGVKQVPQLSSSEIFDIYRKPFLL